MKREDIKRVLLCRSIFILALLTAARATTQGTSRPLTFSGSVGIYLEDYKRFGQPRRRPPQTARLYFRPSLRLFGVQTGLNLDLFLTTEQARVAQQLNTIGLKPSWSWGGLSLGDFYPAFSDFTLNNVRVRGAGLKLNPGLLRFSVAAGETQKASTKKGAEAYRRMLYAVRMGIGKASGSYLDVNLIKAEDLTGSLASSPDLKISPQENLVASVAGRLSLFRNRFQMSGEIAASGHTRDRRSQLFEEERIPEFLAAIFRPRLSTKVDYAYAADARVELSAVSVGGGVRYVGPGYTTLGVSSMFNDLKEVHADGAVRLFRNRFSLRSAFASQWDNLLGQKRSTTQRQRASFNLTMLPVRALNTTFSLLLTTMNNRAPVDSLRMDFYSISANGSMALTFAKGFFIKSARVAGSYSLSENGNRSFRSQRLESHRLSASLQVGIPFSLVVSPTASVVRTKTGTGSWKWIRTVEGAISRARPGRLSPSLRASYNDGSGAVSYRATLQVDYRVTRTGTLSLNARAENYLSQTPGMKSYLEVVSSLSYNQRF
jgi:hypothetical protein